MYINERVYLSDREKRAQKYREMQTSRVLMRLRERFLALFKFKRMKKRHTYIVVELNKRGIALEFDIFVFEIII